MMMRRTMRHKLKVTWHTNGDNSLQNFKEASLLEDHVTSYHELLMKM